MGPHPLMTASQSPRKKKAEALVALRPSSLSMQARPLICSLSNLEQRLEVSSLEADLDAND